MTPMSPEAVASPKLPKGQEALLKAVISVVAQKGLRGLTFRSLAAEANVSPALATHHFGTRETLIEEALKWSTAQAVASTHLQGFATSEDDYRDALTTSVVNETDLHIFQFEMILEARRRPELQPQIDDLYNTYLSAIKADAQSLGLSNVSDATFRAVFACIDGLIIQYLGGAITIQEFRESALLMWDLVIAKESQA